LVNLCIHVNYQAARKIVGLDAVAFVDMVKVLAEYARASVDGSGDIYELQAIYSEII